MQVERFGHAAIRVRDLAAAESFYGSLLGFSVAHRYPDDNEVMFQVGNDDQLLVQAVGRGAPKADPSLPGLHHIAFVVTGGVAGLHRMRERVSSIAVKGSLRRCAPLTERTTQRRYPPLAAKEKTPCLRVRARRKSRLGKICSL